MGFILEEEYHRRLSDLGIEKPQTPKDNNPNETNSSSDSPTNPELFDFLGNPHDEKKPETFKCQCGSTVKFYLEEDHRYICKMQEIECPFGCELLIPRGEMSNHLKICKMSIVICKIVDKKIKSICNMEVPRNSVEDHWKLVHKITFPIKVENPTNQEFFSEFNTGNYSREYTMQTVTYPEFFDSKEKLKETSRRSLELEQHEREKKRRVFQRNVIEDLIDDNEPDLWNVESADPNQKCPIEGCEEVMPRSKILAHLESCPKYTIICHWCGKEILKKDYEYHCHSTKDDPNIQRKLVMIFTNS